MHTCMQSCSRTYIRLFAHTFMRLSIGLRGCICRYAAFTCSNLTGGIPSESLHSHCATAEGSPVHAASAASIDRLVCVWLRSSAIPQDGLPHHASDAPTNEVQIAIYRSQSVSKLVSQPPSWTHRKSAICTCRPIYWVVFCVLDCQSRDRWFNPSRAEIWFEMIMSTLTV